jgi:hypothetical protein
MAPAQLDVDLSDQVRLALDPLQHLHKAEGSLPNRRQEPAGAKAGGEQD